MVNYSNATMHLEIVYVINIEQFVAMAKSKKMTLAPMLFGAGISRVFHYYTAAKF